MPSTFHSILYVMSPAEGSDKGLARAATMAVSQKARLTVLDVLPPSIADISLPSGSELFEDIYGKTITQRMEQLETLTRPFSKHCDISTRVLVGIPFLEALKEVLRESHDLLMKTAEQPSFLERIFGSNDMQLLRKCPCPLWIMTDDDPTHYDSIVAAVDIETGEKARVSEQLNEQILGLAAAIAESEKSRLNIVHAWHAPSELIIRNWSTQPEVDSAAYVHRLQQQHEQGFQALQASFASVLDTMALAYKPAYHLQRGQAELVIPAACQHLEAKLLVMGTVARTGLSGVLIGNTAEAILEQLRCAVLAVKPRGFICPVSLDD